MNTLNTLGSGQIIFIVITIVVILLIVLILLISKISQKPFIASDGSSFRDKEKLQDYEALLRKLEPLYQEESGQRKNELILGLDISFISMLKNKGFRSKKELIEYKDQFKLLSGLLNK